MHAVCIEGKPILNAALVCPFLLPTHQSLKNYLWSTTLCMHACSLKASNFRLDATLVTVLLPVWDSCVTSYIDNEQ